MRRTRNPQATLPAFVELEKHVLKGKSRAVDGNVALNCPDQLAGDGVERVVTP